MSGFLDIASFYQERRDNKQMKMSNDNNDIPNKQMLGETLRPDLSPRHVWPDVSQASSDVVAMMGLLLHSLFLHCHCIVKREEKSV